MNTLAIITISLVVIFHLYVLSLVTRESRQRQRIIEGQNEIIAKQRQLIEEKMTEKVKEAFEKPKRPRGIPRKNV